MQYRVKEGHTAFLGGALREPGYIHQVEKPYKKMPSWAEKADAKPSKKSSKPKKPQKESVAEGPGTEDLVGFTDESPVQL